MELSSFPGDFPTGDCGVFLGCHNRTTIGYDEQGKSFIPWAVFREQRKMLDSRCKQVV
jgi:hypothetical protein